MSQPTRSVVVAGGGAAGFFAAISAAEAGASVTLLEKSPHLLSKVRISGGGRCNVTHACFDPRQLSLRYPRGGRALIGPFTRFGPRDTIEWFARRGVSLKTEADGRMFPVTDSSETIVGCLMTAAREAGVTIRVHTGVRSVRKLGGDFEVDLTSGDALKCEKFLWAGGGCRVESHPAVGLGHSLVPPVPSLFTFHVDVPWVRELAGVSIPSVQASVPGTDLSEVAPLLFTHTGLSGPAILRLSAWGARILHETGYNFPLAINWLPKETERSLLDAMRAQREADGGRKVAKWKPLPARLWEELVRQAGIDEATPWSRLPRESMLALARVLTQTQMPVTGKAANKDEFVTCGGIPIKEVDFKTMQSRITPGLFFAGEALDIDGITGGFNFQAAWTTGWIAGQAMAAS